MPTPKIFSEEELRARKNARSRQRYLENKERLLAQQAEAYKRKSSDPEFLRIKAQRSADYRARNPGKAKEQNARRRAANPDLAREQSRAWFAANPDKRAEYEHNRRARKRQNGGKLSPGIKKKLFDLQGGHCACCREKFKISDMHLDHIIPLALGGENSDDNAQLLCKPCNQSKYAKHPIDFMQERGFLL
ncbi:HNH endonuclease [Cupriavidus sp. UYPR2.512]|uniref:HNH endonuclease n=1 Tax=Cupriavidus sp. UYPR2.512 TaxID=1080187 RepID=UPI0009DAC4F9|nr:HNH endonuclease signature motif containing protein [Cupriavidus sp. UYPR2.512]UIF90885.1 HNH endonuclease [Cupriavidus necator]